MIGYVVAGPASSPAEFQGGQWRFPVTSLGTGIELRDEHIQSQDWLNAESYPNIVLRLSRTEGATLAKEGDSFRTFQGTLVGEMTIHGTTQNIQIPETTITFLTGGDQTQKIGKDDLLAIRAKYSVTLADYDVSHGVIGSKVAETVEIDTRLVMSTVRSPRNASNRLQRPTNGRWTALKRARCTACNPMGSSGRQAPTIHSSPDAIRREQRPRRIAFF